jgi:adenine-specific DNA-methyltransferase
VQPLLFPLGQFPERLRGFPQTRYMGSKYRLLPWMHRVFSEIEFDTVLDACSGSGCVAYLFKATGKEVTANDFLHMSVTLAQALVENSNLTLDGETVKRLLEYDPHHRHFIEKTFAGIFFTTEDLRFLDLISWNIRKLEDPLARALAQAALVRSCVKRQPRGVFTVAGDPPHYKDGRRDLRLSLRQHFEEQVAVFNASVFDSGRRHRALLGDLFEIAPGRYDLVYVDPPYVPRSDDNCYIKRYHFLEGLVTYWEGMHILEDTRVKKIRKLFTPFSYRRTALPAFERMFQRFSSSIIALSYSSNGYPDLEQLLGMLRRYKPRVTVHKQDHRYHFGTHGAAQRNSTTEYLIVGES